MLHSLRPSLSSHSIMPSVVDLPPEIRGSVWMLLEDDIASLCAVRLVCHQLEEDASPHLFGSITLSTRYATLDLALQLADSPRLRKHPRTLIFDTSTYALDLMEDEDETEEVEIEYRISSVLPGVNRNHQSLDQARTEMNTKAVVAHYYNAKALEAMVISHTLHEALTKAMRLPRLKHLVITDFRSFARTGESPRALSRRVFGPTPPPTRLCSGPSGPNSPALSTILAVADENGVHFESLTCARNPFASDSAEACKTQDSLYLPAFTGGAGSERSQGCLTTEALPTAHRARTDRTSVRSGSMGSCALARIFATHWISSRSAYAALHQLCPPGTRAICGLPRTRTLPQFLRRNG